MTADDVLRYGADRVVIATGAHWNGDGRGANFGPIPGADDSLPHVLTPFQITAGKPCRASAYLILDGDGHFMGITLAEHMANQGKEVTYVCDAPDVAEYGVFTMESFNNKRMLFEKGVKVYYQSLGGQHRTRQGTPELSLQVWSRSERPRFRRRYRARTMAASSIWTSTPSSS